MQTDGVRDGWTPRKLGTSFVSLMSHHGLSIEEIARLAGNSSTRTTEVVYRRELPRRRSRQAPGPCGDRLGGGQAAAGEAGAGGGMATVRTVVGDVEATEEVLRRGGTARATMADAG
jgi:hypothetical protein